MTDQASKLSLELLKGYLLGNSNQFVYWKILTGDYNGFVQDRFINYNRLLKYKNAFTMHDYTGDFSI